MPVTFIKGPTGLCKEAKKELIEGTLRALTDAYQMPDDRVYIDEVPSENVGHTPLLAVTHGEGWAVQSEPARIIIEIIAPPGIPIEAKRTLVRRLTGVAGRLSSHRSPRCAGLDRSAHGRRFRQQRFPPDGEPRHGAVRGDASARSKGPRRDAHQGLSATHGDCAMKHKLVRYKVRPEAVAENRRLIE